MSKTELIIFSLKSFSPINHYLSWWHHHPYCTTSNQKPLMTSLSPSVSTEEFYPNALSQILTILLPRIVSNLSSPGQSHCHFLTPIHTASSKNLLTFLFALVLFSVSPTFHPVHKTPHLETEGFQIFSDLFLLLKLCKLLVFLGTFFLWFYSVCAR